jgi:crotonobetainyl-CoA:carnitine CoA-transferase CaiB-like acyl-CoA transferase
VPIDTQIAAKTALWDRHGLIEALEAAGVPASPINTVAEALNDIQVRARGLVIRPEGIPGLRTPIVFSRSCLSLDHAAPQLGSGHWRFTRPEPANQQEPSR